MHVLQSNYPKTWFSKYKHLYQCTPVRYCVDRKKSFLITNLCIFLILRYYLPCAVMCYHLNLHIFSPRSNMTPTRENAIKIRDSLAKHYVVKFSVKHDHLQWILWIQIFSKGAILILIHLFFQYIPYSCEF